MLKRVFAAFLLLANFGLAQEQINGPNGKANIRFEAHSAPFVGTDASGKIVLTSPFQTNAQSSTYAVTAADFAGYKTIVVASGTFTITLTSSASQPPAGQLVRILNYGSGVITLARNGQNINGGTTSLTIPAASPTAPTGAEVVSDGANYFSFLIGAGGGGGGGGTPGGSNNYVQTNNSGAFGGFQNLTNDGSAIHLVSSETNPTWGDANSRTSWSMSVFQDAWGAQTNPGFTDANGFQLNLTLHNGFYSYGAGTNSKTTSIAQNISQLSEGAAQAFTLGLGMTKWGIGDAGIYSGSLTCRGNPAAGDETTCGVHPYIHIGQDTARARETILNKTVSACPTMTVTGTITGSATPQTVAVTPNTTGCANGDWLVVNQAVPSGFTGIDSIQITVADSTHLTAVFSNTQTSSAVLQPAPVLQMTSIYRFGQMMPIINLSATPYTTGTATYDPGTCQACFSGSGTSWTSGMVGSTAISFTADDDPASPFTALDPLKDWYAVISSTSSTTLSIYSFSVANDPSYRGLCVSGCAFTMRPTARVLRRVGNDTLVLEASGAVWTVGDQVESVLGPFPDVTGMEYIPEFYSRGGTYRSWYSIYNAGHRQFGSAINIASGIPNLAGTDYPWAFGSGLNISGSKIGVNISTTGTAAIAIDSPDPQSSTVNSNITWRSNAGNTMYIGPHGNSLSADILGIYSGTGTFPRGAIQFGDVNSLSNTFGSTTTISPQMQFGGNIMSTGAGGGGSGWLGILNVTGSNFEGWRLESDGSLNLDFHYIYYQGPGTDFETKPFSVGTPANADFGPYAPKKGTATSSVNQGSNDFALQGSRWHAGVARNVAAYMDIVPETGGADATYDFRIRMSDPVNNNDAFPNIPLRLSDSGILSIGLYSDGSGLDHRATLDASSIKAHRTYNFQDANGTFAFTSQVGLPGEITRTLPAAVNDAVDLGTFDLFTAGNYGANYRVSITATTGPGNSTSKNYFFPLGLPTAGSDWVIVPPITSGINTSSPDTDYELEVKNTGLGAMQEFRVRKTLGTNSAVMNVNLVQMTGTVSFTPSTTVHTVSAPTAQLVLGGAGQFATLALTNPPTSCSGQPTGTVASVSGTLTLCP